MTVEQKLKLALGENQFNLIVLSCQLEDAQKKISELQSQSKSATVDDAKPASS